MKELEGKLYYTHQHFDEDTKTLIEELKNMQNPHLVSIYRGSLPIGVRLSNILDIPLSIVDFQTRDNKASPKTPKMLKDANIRPDDTLVLIDDIYDTGITIKQVYEFLSNEYNVNNIENYCLINNIAAEEVYNVPSIKTFRESQGQWVVFEPWESV